LIFLIPSATISQIICATIAVGIENKPTPIPLDMQPVSITETDPEIHIGFIGCTWRQTKAVPKKSNGKNMIGNTRYKTLLDSNENHNNCIKTDREN
jgi:hypothetical protein